MADHVAVATGGGRGIGAAIARRLGADGLALVIADPAGGRLPGAGARPTRPTRSPGSPVPLEPQRSQHPASARDA
jgi:NAD(P)-dependent dehydrogenase (short-subunit alcohol dehydrogenase family)